MPTRRKLEDMSDQERFTVTTIYLATSQGISVVRGSENRWQGATQLEDKQVECVLADHKTRDVAFCGTFGAGLFRTSDAGRAWAPCAGFPEATVTALAAAESGVLFARRRSRSTPTPWIVRAYRRIFGLVVPLHLRHAKGFLRRIVAFEQPLPRRLQQGDEVACFEFGFNSMKHQSSQKPRLIVQSCSDSFKAAADRSCVGGIRQR